ncbi:MAG: ISAs1 family transposase [Treponema sp.]|nr:ISAs1 family transposase [Treponema sp.]
MFSLLDPGSFRKWAGTDSVIAIDGKTVRGSESGERKVIHIVSAWADEMGLALGQVQTEEKSNEITAIPALLEALDISGCIVMIDAAD